MGPPPPTRRSSDQTANAARAKAAPAAPVRDAFDGASRFSQFQRNLGIAKNILAVRLRRLVAAGILERPADGSGDPAGYVLTDRGRDLFTTIVRLRQWGERHAFDPDEPRSELLDLDGRLLDTLQVTATVVARSTPPSATSASREPSTRRSWWAGACHAGAP